MSTQPPESNDPFGSTNPDPSTPTPPTTPQYGGQPPQYGGQVPQVPQYQTPQYGDQQPYGTPQAPQYQAPMQYGGTPVNPHMGMAIGSTVIGFFFGGIIVMILGIIAIVQANKSKTAAVMGDMNTAIASSKMAKTLSIIGFVLSAVIFVIMIFIVVVAAANVDNGSTNFTLANYVVSSLAV